jgi:hypothetical protein
MITLGLIILGLGIFYLILRVVLDALIPPRRFDPPRW